MRNRVEKGNTKVKIELQASESLMIALEKVFENLIEFPDKPVGLPTEQRAFHYPINKPDHGFQYERRGWKSALRRF